MTTAAFTPEIVPIPVLRRPVVRVLDLLIRMLGRSTPRARHRVPSPLKLRLQQWKSRVVGLPVRPQRPRWPIIPTPPPTPMPAPPRLVGWNAFPTVTRKAQRDVFEEFTGDLPVNRPAPAAYAAFDWPVSRPPAAGRHSAGRHSAGRHDASRPYASRRAKMIADGLSSSGPSSVWASTANPASRSQALTGSGRRR